MFHIAGSILGLHKDPGLQIGTDLCSGRMVKRNHCFRCLEMCSTGAISVGKKLSFNEAKCTGCAACTVVCPSHNRILRKTYAQLVEDILKLSKTTHEITFTCDSAQKAYIQVPCLSMVSFEIMLLANAQGITKITLSSCSSCKPKNLHQTISNLGFTQRLLSEADLELDLVFANAISKEVGLSVSRRDFFDFLSKQMRSSVGEILPELGEEDSVSRSKILDYVRTKLKKALYVGGKKYIVDDTKCGNCSLCIRLCPHNAWEKKETDIMEFNRGKCWECGNCLSVCPRENIKTVGGEERCLG